MALTPRRWIALVLTGFFLTPVVVLRDQEHREWRPSERDRLSERNRVAQMHVMDAAQQLRVLQLRDSVVRIASRQGGQPLFVDDAFDPASRALIDSIGIRLRDSRSFAARLPTSVFFILDTASEVRGQPRRSGFMGALALDYVLPTDSIHRCIVLARVRPVNSRRAYEAELRSVITHERLLGPCAFLERFGVPGRAVGEWLSVRGWQFAQRSTWASAPRPWLDGSPDAAYRARIDLDYVMTTAGRGCAGGKDGACTDALLARQPVSRRRSALGLQGGMLSTGVFSPFVHGDNAWLTSSWPLGAREWTLLSDMVRSIGAERFEAFWTSDLPPDQAFQAATGTSIAGWTRRWIEDTYHPQPTGPALPAGATGFAAVLLVAAIGLTIVAARRRQIG